MKKKEPKKNQLLPRLGTEAGFPFLLQKWPASVVHTEAGFSDFFRSFPPSIVQQKCGFLWYFLLTQKKVQRFSFGYFSFDSKEK
ncbi:MAG: hypothetical protein J6K72_12055 [Clostridia bacterium]|nr:hypothetical protein [Clostridia bacterium]